MISRKHQQGPIKDPASLPWHEVKKVDYYWLSVDAMREPMRAREDSRPYVPGKDSTTNR